MSKLAANPCNFCGSQRASHFLTLTDLRLRLPGTWDLVRCEQCGLLFIDPQPGWEELSAHYPNEYHAYLRKGSKITELLRGIGLRNRVNAVWRRTVVEKGQLLDVGCATGEFLDQFRKMTGWDVVGIEIVPEAASYARAKGLKIVEEELPNAGFQNESFDAITLWDVLEHTKDPAETLQVCFSLLKPGGVLVIKVPDPSSKEAALFKESWIGYEAPQHLFGFPKKVLENKLREIGLTDVASFQTGSDYSSFFVSFGHWLNKQNWRKSSEIIIDLVHKPIGRMIAGTIIRPIRFLGIKSSCTYIYQK